MEDKKLSKEEIVPAEDVLTDELAEEVSGGGTSACFKGCTSGDAKQNMKEVDPNA